ncbi:MAG: DHH family phosphoesterase [bacterium]
MDEILSRRYAEEFNIPYELACIVSQRFPLYEEAKRFLYPGLEHLNDPKDIPDMERATADIITSIKKGEDILIYTHDDPDGYTSAIVLYQTLLDIRRNKKPQVYLYPINREKDGYILNPDVLQKYKSSGIKLLITVDFGISNLENFAIARDLGLNLIVCDHHETHLTEFPIPVLDTKRPDSQYPFRELAGVGVTLKLSQSIYKSALGIENEEFYGLKKEFLTITMIGTLADRVMPINENRAICYAGLNAFDEIEKPWAKFFQRIGHINFPFIFNEILPPLQSCALDDPQLGLAFFLEESEDGFIKIIERLKAVENKRNANINLLFQGALELAKVYPGVVISIIPDGALQLTESAKLNNLGAVASQLRDYFHKTAILILVKNNKCYGELRSHDIHLFEFLSKQKDLFLDFGGHKRAAGFSMDQIYIDKFVEFAANTIPEPQEKHRHQTKPEAVLDKTRIGLLEPLLPFGEGNNAPLLTDGVEIYTIDNRMNVIDIGLCQT